MRLALWNRAPDPPELSRYKVEAAFWEHLGIDVDRLDRYPEELVRRYVVVMDEVARWEQGQAELASKRAQAQQK